MRNEKFTRRYIRKFIQETLQTDEGVDDLSRMNKGLLNTGLVNLSKEHADKVKNFLNTELKITNDEFNEIFAIKDVFKNAYDKYIADGKKDIDSLIDSIRQKIKELKPEIFG